MKQDLTEFSENELSLLVFNDEYLYKRRNSRDFLIELDEMFLYTEEQLDALKSDLYEEEQENEK